MPIQANQRASARDKQTYQTLTAKIDKKILDTTEGAHVVFSFHPGTSKRLVHNLASEYASVGWTTSVAEDTPLADGSRRFILELWTEEEGTGSDGGFDPFDLLDSTVSQYPNVTWDVSRRRGEYLITVSGSLYSKGSVSESNGSSDVYLDVRINVQNKDLSTAVLLATTEFAHLVAPLEL